MLHADISQKFQIIACGDNVLDIQLTFIGHCYAMAKHYLCQGIIPATQITLCYDRFGGKQKLADLEFFVVVSKESECLS